MPQAPMPVVDLRSREHYIASCVALAQEKLSRFGSLAEIAAQELEINRYPRLEQLEAPHLIHLLSPEAPEPVRLAKEAVARGEVLFEHAAAGEGTRLFLGPKYFINIARDLSLETIAHLLSVESGKVVSPEAAAAQLDCRPQGLLPLSLGARHMLQLAFDLSRLARELGESPAEMLGRQHLLVIVGEEMAGGIEKDFYQWHFYGFHPARVYFMMQESFHGLNLKNGRFFYDETSPRRLHNHGQMVMQQAVDRQLFRLPGAHAWEKVYQSQDEVGDWLQGFVNKISYNIEDLDYLTGSLDFHSLGLVLELGEKGFRMVMEVVANNPLKPQKGGMLAWDPTLSRDVMIESFQLGDLPHNGISFLNRNFNHYPRPFESWRRVRDEGLPMPVAVKDNFLYYQPVQGDINFLVPTAFFRRQEMPAIKNLKRPAALPLAINRMAAQDRQPGFREFVQCTKEGGK
ncbi:MAG: hypothetical protein HY790_11000 [Deltaproteobacteria bacterium]|nr:hypothetical protein [Deltaproteobacteria bacterium]MBI4796342.1 hypothetical protein [Deltaproteobacteria bacterium]